MGPLMDMDELEVSVRTPGSSHYFRDYLIVITPVGMKPEITRPCRGPV